MGCVNIFVTTDAGIRLFSGSLVSVSMLSSGKCCIEVEIRFSTDVRDSDKRGASGLGMAL